MPKKERISVVGSLYWLARKLPWWVGLPVAAGSWYGLSQVAAVAPNPYPNVSTLSDLGHLLAEGSLWMGAYVGQYLVPAFFGVASLSGSFRRWRERSLYRRVLRNPRAMADGMDWYEFEQLIGEVFRKRGFTAEMTKYGADGGVDLVLRKKGERYLVQCKQWASKVGVGVVRELYGVMAAEGVDEGFVVTSGTFSKDAHEFAQGKRLNLVDYYTLCEWLGVKPGKLQVNTPGKPRKSVRRIPDCPECHEPMILRTAKKGPGAGEQFWGCAHFPSCQGMRKTA